MGFAENYIIASERSSPTRPKRRFGKRLSVVFLRTKRERSKVSLVQARNIPKNPARNEGNRNLNFDVLTAVKTEPAE